MPVGWGNTQQSEPGFGASNDTASVKAKIVNLIASVRTLMRSMCSILLGGSSLAQTAGLRFHGEDGAPWGGLATGEEGSTRWR